MPQLNSLQIKILNRFKAGQCGSDDENDGALYILEDEFIPLVSYKTLSKSLKVSKERLKVEVRELRDIGLVYLSMSVNADYIPSGSGWSLTDKGLEYLNKHLHETTIL